MARLDIKITTLKRLFALSGNKCAFNEYGRPCNVNIVDKEGYIIGEICHIESAEKGGSRYNSDTNDEYRRSFDNLILLCSNHHKQTNNSIKYPAGVLKDMKFIHEAIYIDHPFETNEKVIQTFLKQMDAKVKNYQVIINKIHEAYKVSKKVIEKLLEYIEEKDSMIQFYKRNAADKEMELKILTKKYIELEKSISPDTKISQFLKEGDFVKVEQLLLEHASSGIEEAAQYMSQLALLYSLQLRYDESILYYKKAIEQQPNNYLYIKNLGIQYYLLGAYTEAKTCYEKALTLAEIIDSPDIYNNLGLVYKRFGEMPKAISMFNQAISILLDGKITDEIILSVSYNNLGITLNEIGKYQEAIGYYQQSLNIELKLQINPDQIATLYSNMGLAYNYLGDTNKAIELYQRALKIDLKIYGEIHPNIAIRYNNLGFAYSKLEKYKKSIDFLNNAVEIGTKTLGEYHYDQAIRYINLCMSWGRLNNFDKAMFYGNQAKGILLKTHGENHYLVGALYNNIGGILLKKNQLLEADIYFKKALNLYKTHLGENHPGIITIIRNIEWIAELRSKGW
jgi:tetratricopeptide (TPR) repeat protein